MTEVLASLQQSGLSVWLRESESIWALPTILTLHTLGLGILVGSAFAFDLRVLGLGRSIPLVPLATLFRVMWFGFWINAVTGVLLFMADAVRKSTSPTFLTKMTFVAVGVVTLVLLKRHVYDKGGAHPDTVSSTAKTLALASILAWCAAISAGRLLAYVVEF
jgi:hypothetical protein